ncbi:MAG TPA: hypothetical protein VM580_34100, partial [Labilithrix sp.]|nr:hypothetical protein [Labilithrix sp.]
RPALVRMGAKLPPRTTVPRLTAELRIRAAGRPDVVLQDGPRAVQRWDDGDLTSSFHWELSAEHVVEGAELSVEIRDPSGADPSVIRYPVEGDSVSMNVGALAPTLKVRFVPVKYDADGSGRIPAMDPGTIDAYKDALYKMYPVAAVEISVRDPISWPLVVRGDGEGWDRLLDAIMETREDDHPADDVYYVGVFNPAETQGQYCSNGGCVLGVAPFAFGESATLRTAMIVGYHSDRQQGTLAQELAHTMGRRHAPCGSPGTLDRTYPYANASIGVWGWDLLKRELRDPHGRLYDFMSYCEPVWISDYTFSAIYNHMVEVQRATDRVPPSTRTRVYHVAQDGSLRPGPILEGAGVADSDEVVLENGAHQAVGKIRGAFRPLSGIGGGLLLTPTEIPPAVLVRSRFARLAPR